MRPTPNTVEVCKKIGQFYLNKNEGNYENAATEILRLGFTSVIATPDVVVVELCRPGLFIGKRGENVDKLSAFLGKKIHIIEAESITDFIIPRPEPEYPDYVGTDVPDPPPENPGDSECDW